MIFKWLKSLIYTSEKDKAMLESINKMCEEYEVRVGCGGISKTSKPAYKDKHRQLKP